MRRQWVLIVDSGVWHRLSGDGLLLCSERARPGDWEWYRTAWFRGPRWLRRRRGERTCQRCIDTAVR